MEECEPRHVNSLRQHSSSQSVWDFIRDSKCLVWCGGHQASVLIGKGIFKIRNFPLTLVIKFISILKVRFKMKFPRAASLSITHTDRPIFDVSFLMD